MEYILDEETSEEYSRRIGAWEILAESDKKWQIVQEVQVMNKKANAGAGRNVKRIACKIAKSLPFYINTNVDVIQIKLHKEILLLLPDKVFIIRKGKVGLVNYEDVNIQISQTEFIEIEPIPRDAIVIGSTWQYVNKSGAPDKRYKDNKELPICRYGVVSLTSDDGLNVELQFSNVNKTQDVEQLMR